MQKSKRYVGIDNDMNGGMTDTGKIIRDAWVFELIPETETCEGWLAHGIEGLWEKVNAEWEKYGFRVGGMPPEMQERYMRIQADAMERAKAAGWSGAKELLGDE
ncbi:hypothetical protein [Sinisalibacter lacisalsi]|uniref:Uncharacterized protein n=1 Tax=Sinisalibacter lacisalsi TaxID=1526570 RepID=A0ABQ1QHP7_9RHOB|nr:hypothetical protein [Sinisalibacter lacisalsi]GGD25340.1 hypothetical protein GCM10011358_07240 [Sinisalibacter lacisalsi]